MDYSRKISFSLSGFTDMFSRDSEHRIRSVEKNPPARDPNSRNCETVRRVFGEEFTSRLYGVNMSCVVNTRKGNI